MRIFLAGAGGAIGRRLIPLLARAGHEVVGASRRPEKAAQLKALGATPVIVDVFDAPALERALAAARPQVVVHQLTDLSGLSQKQDAGAALAANARLRREGTANLVAGAQACGARRIVAQSIGWAYAPGPLPHREDAPLDIAAQGERAVTVGGVAALESAVLGAAGLEALVLRYGRLYGPGTGVCAPPASLALHVDGAAFAAWIAVERGAPGVYNVADDASEIDTAKIVAGLGWSPIFRPPPREGAPGASG